MSYGIYGWLCRLCGTRNPRIAACCWACGS